MGQHEFRFEETGCVLGTVMPAKAGIHASALAVWIPAFAGMIALSRCASSILISYGYVMLCRMTGSYAGALL